MYKVNVIGLDQYLRQIESAKRDVQARVSDELRASAMEFEAMAKRNAANNGGDRGGLQKSIGHRQLGPFSFEVFAGVFYAPFIEFGTKKKVRVEPGFEDVAAQFRGMKGSGALTLIEAIKGWVKRKGIAKGKQIDRVAFNIARSIYRNGISPKPFFYKNVAPVRTKLLANVKRIMDGI